jgi:two-component system response regulator RpfG
MSEAHSSAAPPHSPAVTPTVVVLDDQSTGRLILAEVIKGIDRGIHIAMFADPVAAIDYVRQHPVDLVLTDFKMPVLDGVETIRQLRALYTYEQLPIVMTTVVSDREVRHRAFEAGATDFLIRPVDPIECRARCQNLLNLRQQYLINSNHARALEQRVAEVTRELRLSEIETLVRLARAADLRDAVTGAHLKRMARYAGLIARGLGLPDDEVEAIELAAPMHDIGKLCLPDAVLQQHDERDTADTAILHTHPRSGHDILKGSPSRFLQIAASIALHHHEKFDGSGYPFGLAGSAIPLEARIATLADVFDALTSARPGRAAWDWGVALDFLVAQKGRHFDPALVDVLLRQADEAAVIYRSLADSSPA